jgi:hypothetical protein
LDQLVLAEQTPVVHPGAAAEVDIRRSGASGQGNILGDQAHGQKGHGDSGDTRAQLADGEGFRLDLHNFESY